MYNFNTLKLDTDKYFSIFQRFKIMTKIKFHFTIICLILFNVITLTVNQSTEIIEKLRFI